MGLERPAPLPGWVPDALRGWLTGPRMQSAAHVFQGTSDSCRVARSSCREDWITTPKHTAAREGAARPGRALQSDQALSARSATCYFPGPRPHTPVAGHTRGRAAPRLSWPGPEQRNKALGNGRPRHHRGEARPLPQLPGFLPRRPPYAGLKGDVTLPGAWRLPW